MIRDLRSFPNILTLLRLMFIPLIVINVLDRSYHVALALFVAAGVSDGLDGLLARALKQRTVLGEYLDPVADKLLLSTMFVVLSISHDIPWRVTILVFSRDILILIVAAILYATNTLRDFRPSIFGKANTFVQILAVLASLVVQVWPEQWVYQVKVIALWATIGLTVISGFHYVLLVGKRTKHAQV